MELIGRMKNKFSVSNQLSVTNGFAVLLGLSLFFSSCDKKKASENSEVKNTIFQTKSAPVFNADSSYDFVAKQVSFGYRIPNTEGHRKCGDYLIKTFEKYGCKVTVQAFEAKTHDNQLYKLRNIVGSINPDATKRIIISAHWDTRAKADQDVIDKDKPLDGANDAGSGVAVLLELARAINQFATKPNVGIDLICWDGEDNGDYNTENSWCLGSQHWSSEKHVGGYHAFYGVNLDMVGGKNAKYGMEANSMHYAPSIVKKIWDTANGLGYGNQFVYTQVGNVIDDHLYVNIIAKIPMADIIEYDNSFNPSWHTHSDNMNVIDRNSLKSVGQTLLQVIYNE
jgi:glutaminyl-peptide cyclotransferase